MQGEPEEALRIRRKEQLPIFERLGDVSSHAVTVGKIADVLETRGELDEALRICREQLPVYERLGDVRSRAVALYKIASSLLERDKLPPDERQEAIKTLAESFAVFRRLDEPQGIAFVGLELARILSKNEHAEALKTLAAAESAFERLGDTGRLTDIRVLRQKIEREALRRRE